MKKIFITVGIGLLTLVGVLNAQVKDISITVAPTAEYVFWNKDLVLKDGPMVGGRIGFGFGRFFEVRGLYMKSIDLKGTVDGLNISQLGDLVNQLKEQKVEVTRWGGELKANIGTGTLSPYITLGTGVQKFEYKILKEGDKAYEEEQIYANIGLGIKVNLGRRVVLALEGKNTVFNVNENNAYLKPETKNKGTENRLFNWSGLASLEFYLGGRSPEEMTDLDEAYMNTFSDGFKSTKFVIEPGVKYLDFERTSMFKDTYMLGASAGIDFNKFIGIRGFYYRATKENKKLDLNFNDNLSMYGGNLVAKLNYPTGIVPYLTLGGGYLDVKEKKYIDKLGGHNAKSTGFAYGGIGVEVSLARNIVAYGAYNALLTTGGDIKTQDVSNPSELHTNKMYDFGLRFMLGSSAKSPNSILVAREEKLEMQQQEELERVRQNYETRINKLNKDLEQAYAKKDVATAVKVIKEKKEVEKSLNSVKEIEGEVVVQANSEYVKLTGEELESMVKQVLGEMGEYNQANQPVQHGENANVQNRIDMLERLLLQMNATPYTAAYNNAPLSPVMNPTTPNVASKQQPTTVAPANTSDNVNQEILRTLQNLNKQVEKNTQMIEKTTNQNTETTPSTVVVNTKDGTDKVVVESIDKEEQSKKKARKVSTLMYDRLSFYTGPSFNKDGAFLWNLGLRGHYFFSNSNVGFMPEFYVGLGKNTGFGLSGNATYSLNIKKLQKIKPYVGAGLGITSFDNKIKFGTNIIIGTSVNVWDGNLYVDYSVRGLFRDHQIAVGYRLNF